MPIPQEKELKAVKCEACSRLHETTSSTWITIYGTWEYGSRTRSGPTQYGFGTAERPTIVCDKLSCIAKAIKLPGYGDLD